jgi:thiol:disulfide interchange protein
MPPVAESSTRVTPRWLIGAAAILLAGRIALEVAAGGRPAESVSELVKWRPIGAEIEEARASNKPVLYDFTADWCAPCQKMKQEVFADRRSAGTIEQLFVPVRVLDRTREEGRNATGVAALQARYGVEAFPTLVIVDPLRPEAEPVMIRGFGGREDLMRRLTSAGVEARLRRTQR